MSLSQSQHSMARPRSVSAAASVSSLLAIFSLAILKLKTIENLAK